MINKLLAVVASVMTTATLAGTFEMVSLRDGTETPPSEFQGGEQPAITPDGRYIVFRGNTGGTNPLAANTGGYQQVYLRDRVNNTTELISRNSQGVVGDHNSYGPFSISDDGCRVAFNSYATNLDPVAGDASYLQNVFVRDRCANSTLMIDVWQDSKGIREGGHGFISPDGRKVAFFSYSGEIVPGLKDKNGNTCSGSPTLYIHDLDSQTTMAPTYNGACVTGSGPALSYDGSRMAFYSWGSYALPNPNGMWQIWVYDVSKGSFKIASASAAGQAQRQTYAQGCPGEGTSTGTLPIISRNGSHAAFRSRGAGMTNDNTCAGISQVYVKNIDTGEIVMASVDNQGNPGNGDSSGSGEGYRPGISSDGRYVAFHTYATNLVPDEYDSAGNVALHDLWTGTMTGLTIPGDNGTYFSSSSTPAISASGRHVVFYSESPLDTRFQDNSTNTTRGYFLHDRAVPLAPTLTYLVSGGSQITLHFTPPPSDPNGDNLPITSYQARCEGKKGAVGTATGSGSPITVTGLKGGTSYWCSVSAINSAGASSGSNAILRKGASIAPLLGILLD